MGALVYAQNALLWQIISFNTYFIEGLGLGTETLVGNFKGKGDLQQLPPLITVSLLTAFVVGIFLGGVCLLFPHSVFKLFTDHTEITDNIDIFVPWLLLALVLSSIDFTLEGYFLGLAQGHTLRNVSLAALAVVFIPIDCVAIKFSSNHILWLSLSLFYAMRTIMFTVKLSSTFASDANVNSIPTLEGNSPLPVNFEKINQKMDEQIMIDK
jgi:MATE family multidrug resistance protein